MADSIEWALRDADAAQLVYRAGRVRGRGYVHENEAASEILEEVLQPDLDDLARRAALGLDDAARQIGLGLLRGLANCRAGVQDGTVLAYAGPDVTDELAWSVREALTKAGALKGSNRLQPTSAATTVRLTDGKSQVLNGPYAESKDLVSGYVMVKAANLAMATEMARTCPMGESAASVEIREIKELLV